MPQNQLLHCSCNIVTDADLLFTKSPRSEFQDILGKVFILLSFFRFILLLYGPGMNCLAGFTLYEFGTTIPRCCHFMTVSSLIPLQWFDCSDCFAFAVLIPTSFLNIMTSFHLSMLNTVMILLEPHAIRSCPLQLVGWTLDGYFQHWRFLVALIDEKEADYYHLLLVSYAGYHLY